MMNGFDFLLASDLPCKFDKVLHLFDLIYRSRKHLQLKHLQQIYAYCIFIIRRSEYPRKQLTVDSYIQYLGCGCMQVDRSFEFHTLGKRMFGFLLRIYNSLHLNCLQIKLPTPSTRPISHNREFSIIIDERLSPSQQQWLMATGNAISEPWRWQNISFSDKQSSNLSYK